MGRQSARIYFNGQDHKEMVIWDGSKYVYHDKAYIWNGSEFELVWEKLPDEDIEGMVIVPFYPRTYSSSDMATWNWGISNDKKYLYFFNQNHQWPRDDIYRTSVKDCEKYRYSDGDSPPYELWTHIPTDWAKRTESNNYCIISGLFTNTNFNVAEKNPVDPNIWDYYNGADLYDVDKKSLIFHNAKTYDGLVERPHRPQDIVDYRVTKYNSIRVEQDLVSIEPKYPNIIPYIGYTVWMHTNASTPSKADFVSPTLNLDTYKKLGFLSTTRFAYWKITDSPVEYIDIFNPFGIMEKSYHLEHKAIISNQEYGILGGRRYLAYTSENNKLCVGTITPDKLNIEETDITSGLVGGVSPSGRYVIYAKGMSQGPWYLYDIRKQKEIKLKFTNAFGQKFNEFTGNIQGEGFLSDRIIAPYFGNTNGIFVIY